MIHIQLQEVVDDLGAQAQVPDLERGFLELALLALRVDEDQADGAERRFDCLHPEFGTFLPSIVGIPIAINRAWSN